jgi:hypothetical protein
LLKYISFNRILKELVPFPNDCSGVWSVALICISRQHNWQNTGDRGQRALIKPQRSSKYLKKHGLFALPGTESAKVHNRRCPW